jgi:3-hydroxy-9,10-secoandrosta-1,3,5(10)-triene-9,17-dione monooxygenase reductase component
VHGNVSGVSSPDIAQFKHVSSHFVTGVVVVSAHSSEGLAGFTCQTFGSLSLEPMLVFFSASTQSQSWPLVRRAGTVGINILAADQESLARVFATRSVDKFADVAWSGAPGGAPLLAGALAHLEGDRFRRSQYRKSARLLPRRIRRSRRQQLTSLRFVW